MTLINSKLRMIGALLVLFLIVTTAHSQNIIPTPEQTLGFKVGADFKLGTYEQSITYFKKLDASSDLIQLKVIGETSEGSPWYAAFISSKKNLDNIEHYRSISQQLAHPANLTQAEAK